MASVISPQKLLPSGCRTTRMPWIGASGLAGEQRDQRIDLAGPAEEGHLDAAGVVLVDQHADMHTGLQQPRELHRRVEAGRDQIAHERRAQLDDGIADRR